MLISEFQEAVIRLLSRVGIVVVLFLGAVVLLNRPKTTPPPKAIPAADSAVPSGTSVPSARSVAENFARATVDIRAVGDSHLQRQFEITGFHGTGWVLPE